MSNNRRFTGLILAAITAVSPVALADQPQSSESTQADTTPASTNSNGSAYYPEIDLAAILEALLGSRDE